MLRWIHVSIALLLLTTSVAFAQSRLADIRARGEIRCGVNGSGLAGFAAVGADGRYAGFDVEFCRAIAAAVFGNPDAVAYRGLSAQERFTAVQTGEVDVLIRNTTWTASRDSQLGLDFTATTFYDGQGFMVRRDSGIRSVVDMEGRAVCVQSGTTTELNLADVMAALDISYTPVVFETSPQLTAAYDDGQCDAYTTDKSGLVATQPTLRVPGDHVILADTISKEPLGPSVLHGDDQWFDVVQWVVFATKLGEEYGVTMANVDDQRANSLNPEVRRLLGADPAVVEGLGLSGDAFYNVIKLVGNYGEIYDRHLGAGSQFNIPRGLNDTYLRGGLIYAPPIR